MISKRPVAGIITCLLPIFTIINARIFLHEKTSAMLGAGAALVVAGILIIGRAEAKTITTRS